MNIHSTVKKFSENRGKARNDRREEILRSAASAFQKKGFLGTTMQDISRQLKMTQGNLYHYFKNKQDILFQCHDYSLNLVLQELERIQNSPLSPEEKLRALILFHVGVMVDELQASAMVLELHALSPARLKKIVQKRDAYERGVREIISEGMNLGIFEDYDPKLVGFFLFGAINWLVRWFNPVGQRSAKEVAEAFSNLFIDGLRKRVEKSTGTEKGEKRQ